MIFENLGWHLDYYCNGKFIGCLKLDKPDRKKAGYSGRIHTVLKDDLFLKGKRYRKGSVVTSECIPLCGKVIA